MRLLAGALAVTLAIALPAVAKRADFFALDLRPGATSQSDVCGKRVEAAEARSGSAIAAAVSLRAGRTSRRPTPFVIAVQRCSSSKFQTLRRIKATLPAGRRSARVPVRLPRTGDYRIEARLNGDRPPPVSAVRYVVATRAPAPRILSATYGRFRPKGASSAYDALKVTTLDPDGQVVGMQWERTDPPQSPTGMSIFDGGCGLAAGRNGEVGTWYLPMTLAPGQYRFAVEMTSSSCGPGDEPQTVRQTVSVTAR